jgi:hypothetical protein
MQLLLLVAYLFSASKMVKLLMVLALLSNDYIASPITDP